MLRNNYVLPFFGAVILLVTEYVLFNTPLLPWGYAIGSILLISGYFLLVKKEGTLKNIALVTLGCVMVVYWVLARIFSMRLFFEIFPEPPLNFVFWHLANVMAIGSIAAFVTLVLFVVTDSPTWFLDRMLKRDAPLIAMVIQSFIYLFLVESGGNSVMIYAEMSHFKNIAVWGFIIPFILWGYMFWHNKKVPNNKSSSNLRGGRAV